MLNLCSVFLLLIAGLFFSESHSKPVSPDEGKAALLTAILDHTRWPDEAKAGTFVIGLYGRDRSLYRIVSEEFSGKQIRGKPVQVRNIESLSQARNAQVLILNQDKNSDLRRIVDFLDKRPTLIVTDSSDDERHVMINFTHPAENILSFELNRSNIVYAGLDLSKEILLFGGTELDTALIYKETEAELARAKELAMKQRDDLAAQERRLAAQEEKIQERDNELAAKESMLSSLESSLEMTRKNLSESEAKLVANEEALRRKESVLSQKEQAINSYSREISKNLSMLESQRAALDVQQKEIDQKESLIAEKNAILKQQVTTIENQKLFLVWGALALLVVLTLIGIIARSYRIKNKLNKALESKTSELEQVNRQLVTMTEAKSQFLSTMSHEIRTPLNGVIGVAELLESTELTKHQSEYVSIILKSGDTLLSLINDILDISKIEAGKLELENVPFNLGEILGDTLQTLSLKANEKELELAFHIPPEVPNNIVGDPGRFRQIIVNLVGNAIKFTERGEIVVDLKLESSDSTKVRLGFEVRDTGIGISENQLQKIFEAFGQADSSTTRQYGGTGLGQTIASQLVAMMGGELKVSSEAGVGSTFSFSAEFKVSDELDSQPHSPADLKNKKVLVVDDNSTNRLILEEILRSWNMHVEVAQSGPDAIELLEQSKNDDEPYSLAVLDVMMPGMDGFELAEKIRQDAFFKTMRVLVLSSTEFAGNEKRQKR